MVAAADLHVLRGAAEEALRRARVAQRLLERVLGERRVLSHLGRLAGLDQQVHGRRDQVARGLVPGDDELRHHAEDLVVGEHGLVAVLRQHEVGHEVVLARVRAPVRDELQAPVAELATVTAGGERLLRRQHHRPDGHHHRVPPRHDAVHPVPRDVQDVREHRGRERSAELADQLAPAAIDEARHELLDVLLDRGAHGGDPRPRERLVGELSDALVRWRVGIDERRDERRHAVRKQGERLLRQVGLTERVRAEALGVTRRREDVVVAADDPHLRLGTEEDGRLLRIGLIAPRGSLSPSGL